VQRLQAATESLARAAAQIKAVEEAVHKTAHAAENLPYRMQEKLAEFNETLAARETEEHEALERELEELRAANADNLKAVAERVAKTTAEWTALEAAARKQLAAVHEASTKLNEQLRTALADLDARLASLNRAAASIPTTVTVAAAPAPVPVDAPRASEPVAPAPVAEPADAVEPPPPEAPAAPLIESVTLSDTPPAEAKPKKPRAPRKPKPEDTLAAMSSEPAPAEAPAAAEATPVPLADEPAAALEESPAKAESSASSDGATRLLVTAYIGIGNKLFIRGDGPGLSWDRGVPMQFVSIGKWGWASHDATGPVKCKLYKNDESAALSGEVTLEPGKHVEITALF
jgi:hypothetical protein